MSRPVVTLTRRAEDTVSAAAIAAAPRETGGILLGWRDTAHGGFTVTGAIEVPDTASGHATYRRQHAAAEGRLQEALARHNDPDVGYVGEWHSHPAPQPPSPQDRHSIKQTARGAPAAVVLLVPALDPGAGTFTWHALAAARQPYLPRVTVKTASVVHQELP